MADRFFLKKIFKGVSFLPRTPSGIYAQMPIEAISPEKYESIISTLPKRPIIDLNLHNIQSEDKSDPDMERHCDSSICVLD